MVDTANEHGLQYRDQLCLDSTCEPSAVLLMWLNNSNEQNALVGKVNIFSL